MPLSLFVDTLENVPEDQRALYVAKDGKFALDVSDLDAYVEKQSPELLNALRAEREKNREIKSLGHAPSQIKAILADLESAASNSEIFKTMLAQHETKAAADKLVLENENKAIRDHEHAVIREVLLEAGLRERRVVDTGMKLFPKILNERYRVESDGSKRSIVILTKEGTPLEIIEADGKKRAGTFRDLISETVKEWPDQFEGLGGGGGGSQRYMKASESKTLTMAQWRALSPADQMQKIHVEKYKLVD